MIEGSSPLSKAMPNAQSLYTRVTTFVGSCGTSHRSKRWFNWDICGMICSSFVWIIDISALFGTMNSVIYPWLGFGFWGILASLLLFCLVVLSLLCHLRAMLSNPGAVPAGAKPADVSEQDRACNRCNGFKPSRAHHCSICKRCIIKMDHHCPWINSCVGLANHKFFIQFVFYVFCVAFYHFLLLCGRYFFCDTEACRNPSAGATFTLVFETVLSLLFMLFAGGLLYDQISNVYAGTTGIERLKKSRGGRGDGHSSEDGASSSSSAATLPDDTKSCWHNWAEVFGGDPGREGVTVHWFLPTRITFRNPEALTGYCFRDIPRQRTAAEMEMV